MIVHAALAAIIVGCIDPPSGIRRLDPEEGGSLQVTVLTSGTDFDQDGYILVAGRPSDAEGPSGFVALPVNGSATLAALVPDTYTLSISGLAANCDLVSPARQKVTVASGSASKVAIEVRCTNSLQLTYLLDDGVNGDNSTANTPQFWIIGLNGGSATRLTNDTASHTNPAWSFDGSMLAFVSNRGGRSGIWVLDSTGIAVTLTTGFANDFGPRWSPDGQSLVFFSPVEGKTQLFRINIDGTHLRSITAGSPGDYDPDWSPDGSRIAFASKREDIAGIWVVNADGTAPIRLTSSTTLDTNPVWSPDGAMIAFSRVTSRNQYELWTMNSDGSDMHLRSIAAFFAPPAWSPTGRKFAYRRLACITPDSNCQGVIQIVGVDGTGYTPITVAGTSGDIAWRQRR
jgi:Tol biopolymer transport system component